MTGPSYLSSSKKDMQQTLDQVMTSWIKQTILMCYTQADQEALDFVQIKAHIRAFAASKAFMLVFL